MLISVYITSRNRHPYLDHISAQSQSDIRSVGFTGQEELEKLREELRRQRQLQEDQGFGGEGLLGSKQKHQGGPRWTAIISVFEVMKHSCEGCELGDSSVQKKHDLWVFSILFGIQIVSPPRRRRPDDAKSWRSRRMN